MRKVMTGGKSQNLPPDPANWWPQPAPPNYAGLGRELASRFVDPVVANINSGRAPQLAKVVPNNQPVTTPANSTTDARLESLGWQKLMDNRTPTYEEQRQRALTGTAKPIAPVNVSQEEMQQLRDMEAQNEQALLGRLKAQGPEAVRAESEARQQRVEDAMRQMNAALGGLPTNFGVGGGF